MRGLVPDLPCGAWTLLAGDTISAVGSGLTLPFLLVYLHQVRGLGLGEAGLALSTLALAGLVGNPAGGSLADRAGARAALIAGLVCAGAGSALLAFAARPWTAFAAVATFGFGAAVAWPARDALRATIVPPERRASAYGLAHAATNAGLGVGALLAALIVDTSSPASFQVLYLLDAVSFLAVVGVLLRLRAPEPASKRAGTSFEPGAYGSIARNRAFLRLWALTALIVGAGFSQYTTAFPVFATGPGGLDAHQLALVFGANTAAVVVLQLPVVRFLRGRRRTSALAFGCAATAVAWVIVLAGGGPHGPIAAVTIFSFAMVVLALGESTLAPSAPALANDLSPDAYRGRYNGVYTLAWTTGFAVGPVISGTVLAAGHSNGLMLGLIAAAAAGALGSLRLARHLPTGIDAVEGQRAGLLAVPA
jgi:MFS family permease